MHGLRIAVTTGVATCVCVAPAEAEQRWVVIQQDADGTVYLADSEFTTDTLLQVKTIWAHAIYKVPRYGMKSLKVEYTIYCANRTIKETRYIEYDSDDNVVFSGNYTTDNSPKPVQAGSNGERLLTFACSNSSFREQSSGEVEKSVDYRKPSVADSEPQIIVSTPVPSRAVEKSANATESPRMAPSIYRYRECVVKSAGRFTKSTEIASVMVKAAMANCQVSRMQVVTAYANSEAGSPEERRQYILNIDDRMQALAKREVLKLRSK